MDTRWMERMSGWPQHADDARTPFDVDYGRIVHSGSFRRLQGKTQILNLGDSDFYRTRLTHSLEVAQIAGGLVGQLRKQLPDHPANPFLPPESLVQALGFAHDLGHPPFGHGGEVALNYCMRDCGGFEGNGHTLRILAKLESFSAVNGADLTRRAVLGVIKYPVPFSAGANPAVMPRMDARQTAIRLIDRKSCKPPKCYLDSEQPSVEWALDLVSPGDRDAFGRFELREGEHAKPLHKSLDCSIMDLADDIAYGVHDLEDCVALGLVDEADFGAAVSEKICEPFLSVLKARYPKESDNDVHGHFVAKLFADGDTRKRFIGRLVHHFMTHLEIETKEEFREPLLRYRVRLAPAQSAMLGALKNFVADRVIRSPGVQHLEFKGQKMVVSVFEALQSEPEVLLPSPAVNRWREAQDKDRIVCDYVAGMTDDFLLKTYDRLFSPRIGSIFDRL